MKPQDFSKHLDSQAIKIKQYTMNRFPTKAGKIAERFVNGNFRAQGFQGTSFKKWKANKRGGTILIKTGKLRAGTFFTTQPGQATIKNQMPYAKAHNEGFKKTVSVKAHTRNQYSKTKVGTGKFTKKGKERKLTMTMKSGETNVRAHTRKMNIEQRQFAPTKESPSPVLNNAIVREITKDLTEIMK